MSGRMDHDGAFKNVFSEPRMMADFIRGFVGKSWVERANFSTLEPVGTEHVSDRLDRRRGDLAWRLELDDGSPQYVVVMLELQSTVEWAMPLRMAVYVGLTLQAEVKQGRVEPGQLPPVEAVVLYTGREPWDWSLRLSDLYMPCPEDVAARQLGIECTLVQACHEQDLDLEPLNLSDAVFRLLRGSRAEVADVASRLQRRLAGPEDRSLLGAITRLVQEVVLPTRARMLPESERAKLTNLEDLTPMLDNYAITFEEAERAKLIAQGKAEGKAEGPEGPSCDPSRAEMGRRSGR